MSGGPKTGDRFDYSGYELMARIAYGEGDGYVLVMHNNSSHVLVAVAGHDESVDARDSMQYAVLVASFPYFMEEEDWKVAYRYALMMAMKEAIKR